MKSFKWLKANTWDKWSLTTKLLLLIPLILTLIIFVFQQFQHSNDNDFLKEEFIKTQRICSENNNCEIDKNNPTVVYTDLDSLEGNCPHIHLEKEANTMNPKGTISLWTKLNHLDLYEDRTIFDMIDYDDKTFVQLSITNNNILKYKIRDLNGQEFILNYNNIKPFSNWTFIVATWDEQELNLFVNDELKSSVSINNANFNISIKDWYFGSNHNKRFCLNGLLDEAALFGSPANKYDVINMYEHYEKKCRPIDDCYKEVNLWFKVKVFFSKLF